MWVDVVGYEGLYKINEYGEIVSIPHIRKNGVNGSYLNKGRIRKQIINPSGYPTLRLSKNGITKTEFVHVLVAKSFIENPFNLPYVNHKDENKLNSHVSNLEWCDSKYNQVYSFGKPVLEIDKDGNKKVYRSLSEFEQFGIHYQYIQNAIKHNKEYKDKKYSFITVDEYNKIRSESGVYQMPEEGEWN